MCLFVKKDSKILERAIICYKIVQITEKGNYITCFRERPINIGEAYHSIITKHGTDTIEEALHSFKTISISRMYIRRFFDMRDYKIVKCTIPKGAEVYEGIFISILGNHLLSYASSDIIYKKFVE